MPPAPILDLAQLDCDRVLYTREQIYSVLPQQFEMSQLDGIIYVDVETSTFAAYRDVRADEWWCRGHMPGRPIFPGVMMLETAAQLCAFAQKILLPEDSTVMGFAGVDGAKFRDSIFPPSRIIMIGRAIDPRLRKFTCGMQAYVNGNMAFEGVISGIRLKI